VLPSASVVVNKFLGIPFAVSPPERFAPPVPAKQFSEPVVAQAWSPACIQQFDCE
jgi:carboxylesterase type B